MGRLCSVIASLVLATGLAAADPASEGRDLYNRATAADQAGNYKDALTLAQRATAKPGPHANAARLLYADVLVHQGELERAKDFYIALHKRVSADLQVMIEARLAAIGGSLPPASTPPPPTTPTGPALFRQAQTAFQAGDFNLSLKLAQQSSVTPGRHSLDAKVLYADSLYRLGEIQRAKAVYVHLLTMTTGVLKAAVTKRVTAANRALALPDDTP